MTPPPDDALTRADRMMPDGERRILRGARIFTGDRVLDGAALLLGEGRVLDIVEDHAPVPGALSRTLAAGSWLAPGFIDIQVNGGGGVLFNADPTVPALRALVAAHRRFGTTALLPTLITDTPDRMAPAVDAAAALCADPDSGVLGIHLEGPYISREKRGVHNGALVRAPSAADIDYLTTLPARFPGGRVLLTLAPEVVADADIARLRAAGIVLAGGHSAASAARTREAIAQGVSGFTHLFNAMPPLLNREPGIAGAALDDRDTWCGIIADGIHVHPLMLRLALAAKGRDRLFLVTDAMPPTGTDADHFILYGQTIHRRDGRLVTDDGVLAGADIDMAAAVRGAVRLLGVAPEDALAMASAVPAHFLGLDHDEARRGRLIPGGRADIVALTPDLTPLTTWVGGRPV